MKYTLSIVLIIIINLTAFCQKIIDYSKIEDDVLFAVHNDKIIIAYWSGKAKTPTKIYAIDYSGNILWVKDYLQRGAGIEIRLFGNSLIVSEQIPSEMAMAYSEIDVSTGKIIRYKKHDIDYRCGDWRVILSIEKSFLIKDDGKENTFPIIYNIDNFKDEKKLSIMDTLPLDFILPLKHFFIKGYSFSGVFLSNGMFYYNGKKVITSKIDICRDPILNTVYEGSLPVFNGKYLFYEGDCDDHKKPFTSENGTRLRKLYSIKYENGKWGKPVEFISYPYNEMEVLEASEESILLINRKKKVFKVYKFPHVRD